MSQCLWSYFFFPVVGNRSTSFRIPTDMCKAIWSSFQGRQKYRYTNLDTLDCKVRCLPAPSGTNPGRALSVSVVYYSFHSNLVVMLRFLGNAACTHTLLNRTVINMNDFASQSCHGISGSWLKLKIRKILNKCDSTNDLKTFCIVSTSSKL